MRPKNEAAAEWGVKPLCSEAELCRWLDLPIEKLLWLADVNGRERQRPKEALRNYSYRWILKRSSGARLIESPKTLLKSIQRRILEEILTKIPPHPAACGFSRGGSILLHAEGHSRQHSVVKMDVKDFFLSITMSRVWALFKSVGYPETIARLLAGLCTNSVPLHVLGQYPERMSPILAQKLRTPHLPQGAPTSPQLANLCAYRLDVRLSALAKHFEWFYSRYADDLLFSGPKQSTGFARRLEVWAGAVAIEERLALNHRKTRSMRRDQRQRACGLVLNEKPNVPREDYDALKALLFNCARLGPASQNREKRADFRAHLLGRIGFVVQVHAGRGAKLRGLFEKIDWR
jgi:retron-type reverse transcriptase